MKTKEIIKQLMDKYPELKAITSYPNSFWIISNPKKPLKINIIFAFS